MNTTACDVIDTGPITPFPAPREISDQEVLNWLAAQGMLAEAQGIKNARVQAYISSYPKLFSNAANGCFIVSGDTPMGNKTSSSCPTVEEAVANWKAFYYKRPEVAANELRAEAKELLRKANEIEAGVAS